METVGVVIRTLNEAELVGTCLETLKSQRCDYELDILVVDSGSTDATLEISRSHGARIHEISPDDFDYSKALNAGIARVGGDLVLILSAHAIPVDDQWVARMTAPFDDPQVAGVACKQVPWSSAPWREVHRLAQTFGDAPAVYDAGNADGILFSNAASCIRRSAWSQERFVLPAAEDLAWAREVVANGWRIVYEPGAAVYHSHDETPREQARRLIDINRAGDAPRPWWKALREAAGYVRRDAKAILALDEPIRRKIAHLANLLAMVAHYVADFSRSGTTAEHRLSGDQDAGAPRRSATPSR
jgi:glycosyltransferase involved in cell wall biosynthesis